ncbi:MAG TPA: 2-amino-4-hydroxy-6-hydroxymethyldihydropteridine diphosphokinase [Fibrobacteria bacterium]|nr:2-amino-4-hydroxy-6-hydroxymethyldihydropteridine diphosphokinase [Fibrobacteria bacterium]HOX51084.1 2-amino-4-hydroxy-6-hydroxymethyldihydropteridine diphosphokinase [Fibrobacteria bacterium]
MECSLIYSVWISQGFVAGWKLLFCQSIALPAVFLLLNCDTKMTEISPVAAYAALGTNLGDRSQALCRARNWIQRIALDGKLEESRIFETVAVGPGMQECHLNQIVRFQTVLNPQQILRFFKEVELWLGRRSRPRLHPREIDIDLLFYGETDINQPELRVPHPGWAARSFVLVPLLDLDPDFHCPVTGISARACLEEHCPHAFEEAWAWSPEEALAV